MKRKTHSCTRCKYGKINEWKNMECWRFHSFGSSDIISKETELRERDANRHNRDGKCEYFIRRNILHKILRIINYDYR